MKDTNGQCQRSAGRTELLYGSSVLGIDIPKDFDIVASASGITPLDSEEVEQLLYGEAMLSYPLEEVIAEAENILIVLPDATRLSGAEQLLPMILDSIEQAEKNFHFIIASGTHRPPTQDELKTILTPDIFARYGDRVLPHKADDYSMMDFYGVTKRKTTVLINKAYREHDTIITIAAVSYHYFAGYGGGRKMIFPGIAGEKAITANHRLALDASTGKRHEKAVTGNLKNNPVHDDMVEAVMIARSDHTFFSVNTLLTDEGRIGGMVCGDMFMSHIKAAEMLDEHCLVDADKKYDLLIVSAGGYPKDINLIQAQKYLDRVTPLLKDGGNVVFVAELRDGYGNKYFEDFFDISDSKAMLASLMQDYRINRQTAFNLKSNLEKYKVYLYSMFSDEDCERIGFSKLEKPEDVAALAAEAETIAVITHPADIFVK